MSVLWESASLGAWGAGGQTLEIPQLGGQLLSLG